MPLNRAAIPLDADPASVKKARDWVCDVLNGLHREDLVDAAELGVSELVTNAILHGEPPITVRVRGTRNHPRVEVGDRSSHPPAVNVGMTYDENLLSTIGRGLGIVALYSSAWGAEVVPDGKTVWFEPSSEPRLEGDLTGDVFDLERSIAERLADTDTVDLVPVRLLGMPAVLFGQFRRRYSEMRRELRLLALAHGEDYPVASELTEVFLEVERERRLARGVNNLDAAIEQGLERVDLDYMVPLSAGETMARLQVLLERADAFCREQRLLVLAASPLQLEFQRWYLGEFVRQIAGEPPTPWTGPTSEDRAPVVS